MYDYFFTFRSVTAAQGGAKRLEKAGIPAMMSEHREISRSRAAATA